MIDNDLKDKCTINQSNQSIQYSLEKIDYYLKNFSSFNQKKTLAKVRLFENISLSQILNFIFLETSFIY
jgi:hypothetical protein